MPNVTLIGDSIRMGYQPLVADRLKGKFDVWGPEENGGNTANLLQNLPGWMLAREPAADIIQINSGLHDLKTVTPDVRAQVVPPDHYRRNVRLLLSLLQENTEAKLIWATTTPVHDERLFLRYGRQHRTNSDVQMYNESATKIAQDVGVVVNDLYGFVMETGVEEMLSDDGVHFTEHGSALLGQTVAEKIKAVLPQLPR